MSRDVTLLNNGQKLASEVREALDWAGAGASAHNALDSLEEQLVKLRRLAEAARPYVENAAPGEQLFNGQDLRNFQRLEAAFAEVDAYLGTERAQT